MNQIDNMIPSPSLTEDEQSIIKAQLSNPLIQKYFRLLALNAAKELTGVSAFGKSPEELVVAHATIRGELSLLSTFIYPKE